MNEKDLIISLKEGNENSFTTLYKKYYGKVYNFSCLYLRNKHEIEEVIQEVFMKLWEVRSFIKENENFESYLFIITRNLIFNQARKSFNEDTYKTTILISANQSYEIDSELEADDLRQYISRLILLLSPRQQEVFKLSREEHMSYKEISERLNITEKTVERHINESLKFLRKNLHSFMIFLSI